MKKIISLLAFLTAIVVMPQVTHAQAFNTDPQDPPTVMVTNVTQSGGCGAGYGAGCWKTSVTANPGDTIAVQVYFHNSTPYLAEDVHLSIKPENSSNVTKVIFTGGVASSTLDRSTDSATVTIKGSAQSVNFIPGTVRLYQHGDTTGYYVSSSEEQTLFNHGLSIGNVSPGWDSQGTLSAEFKVSGNVQPTSYECSDGIDNDGDGRIDYPNDPGCTSSKDNDEYNAPVQQHACSLDLSASRTSVDRGESSVLSWTASNCTNLTLTDSGNVSSYGSTTVYPTSTKTYTLRGYSSNGQAETDSVTIRVKESQQCYINSFDADDTNISAGDSIRLRWSTTGADSVTIYPYVGSDDEDGSRSVTLYQTTTYTLTANCENGGSQSASVTVYVNNNTIQTGSAPQAITNAASILSSTQARLNGIAVPSSNVTTYAWFDWGPTQNLEYHSSKQTITNMSSTYFNDIAGGLTPGHTYYYRAAAQNQYGTTYGSIVPFQTTSSVATTTTVVKYVPQAVTTSTAIVAKSAPSLLELTVESNYDHMCVAGNIAYRVTFKNISTSQTLQNAVTRITLPAEVDYLSSSQGTFNPLDRTLTVVLGNVPPQATGTIEMQGVVNRSAVVGKIAVATATVVYTNTNTHAQEDAIAYSIVTITNDCPSLLGASVFGFSFLPHTLLGWLALILVILALIVLARQIGKKQQPAA